MSGIRYVVDTNIALYLLRGDETVIHRLSGCFGNRWRLMEFWALGGFLELPDKPSAGVCNRARE